MGILKKISMQYQSKPDKANDIMKAAHIIKFVELKLKGNWMRKVISESGNAIQYEIYPGPRVNKAVVIMRSENNSLKTYTYDFADGGSVIVVRDIVHLPVDSTPSVTDSN